MSRHLAAIHYAHIYRCWMGIHINSSVVLAVHIAVVQNAFIILPDLEQVHAYQVEACNVKKPAPLAYVYFLHKGRKWKCKHRVALHQCPGGIAGCIIPKMPGNDYIDSNKAEIKYRFSKRIIFNEEHSHNKEYGNRCIDKPSLFKAK